MIMMMRALKKTAIDEWNGYLRKFMIGSVFL